MNILTIPVMLAIISVFFEMWYLSEEMLVVASIILFLSILVQTIGSELTQTLANQTAQIVAQVQRVEEQLKVVRTEFDRTKTKSTLVACNSREVNSRKGSCI